MWWGRWGRRGGLGGWFEEDHWLYDPWRRWEK